MFKERKKHGVTDHAKEHDRLRCKKCRSEAVIRKRKKLKLTLVTDAGGKCCICGYDKYIGALDFHHIDPTTKSFGLAESGHTRSLVNMRAEAAKCVLLCANCHREVEAGITKLPCGVVGNTAVSETAILGS